MGGINAGEVVEILLVGEIVLGLFGEDFAEIVTSHEGEGAVMIN